MSTKIFGVFNEGGNKPMALAESKSAGGKNSLFGHIFRLYAPKIIQ